MNVNVSVRISHDFDVDVPENLLEDGNEDLLDEYLYEYFIDSDWLFDEMTIRTPDGKLL